MITLQELKFLIAVSEHKHFGRAAESCFVTQPALSIQIKKLEDMLDATLVERTNKSVRITPLGEQVIERARLIQQEVQNIIDLTKKGSAVLEGPFKLGVIPTVAPYIVPLFMAELKEKFPELELYLREEQTEPALELLHKGELDAVLYATPWNDSRFKNIDITQEPFVVALPENHPLATQEEISNNDLRGEEIILLEDGHCLKDHILEACQFMGFSKRTDFQATSLETLKQMIAAGLGITLIPISASVQTPKGLVIRPFIAPAPTRGIALAYRKSSAVTESYQELAEIIRNAM